MPTPEGTAQKLILDFSNVKESSGVNPVHVEAGDYRMKITKVTAGKSGAGNDQWVFIFTPTDRQSAAYPYYCALKEDNLWKVRNLLIACGKDVPKKKVNVDPNKLVGQIVGITLDDDEYEGKMKSVITAVFPASDLDDADVPAQTDEDDEIEEVDEDVEADVEERPEPVRKPKPSKAVVPEPEEDEDEEDEPEPTPAPRKRKTKPAPVEEDVDDEELEEIDVEDL